GGASRQEKAEERSIATVEAFDAVGRPPGRDPQGGAVAPTVASVRSAGWLAVGGVVMVREFGGAEGSRTLDL
ncbi:MAG: hypothetical protein V3R98_06075, partial [Alphaproteobacteria bacterium]